MRRYSLPLVLALGAAGLAYARGPLDLTWNITPLAVGVVALLAAATLPNPRPWTVGIVLVVWGAAVLLVREGPLPGREAPVYMVALGLALLVAQVVTDGRGDGVVKGAALTMLSSGALFYAAFDVPELTRWWVVAAGLGAAAVVEFARSSRGR